MTIAAGALSVVTGPWSPDLATVGAVVSGDVSASMAGGLDGDGTGATYSWVTNSVTESDHGGQSIPFTAFTGNYSVAWVEGGSQTQFADSARRRAIIW